MTCTLNGGDGMNNLTLYVTETESMNFVTFYRDNLDNLASIPATCLHVLDHIMLSLSCDKNMIKN